VKTYNIRSGISISKAKAIMMMRAEPPTLYCTQPGSLLFQMSQTQLYIWHKKLRFLVLRKQKPDTVT